MRPSGRDADQMRVVRFTPDFTRHAEGSVLAEFGDTRVLCTASIENRVPPWLRGGGSGWVTKEQLNSLTAHTLGMVQRSSQQVSMLQIPIFLFAVPMMLKVNLLKA